MNLSINTNTQEEQVKQASKSHILIVDDDKRICELVSRFLHEHGFIALTAHSACAADRLMNLFIFDALVVDVMMEGRTGIQFVHDLRTEGCKIPVLLLTALGEAQDRITGLESGADDYLVKPFEPMELVLRLKAILRRVQNNDSKNYYIIGKWCFDPKHDELRNGNDIIDLTSMEANLLKALLKSMGEVVTRQELASRCNIYDAGERTIDVQVTRLRRKIEENTKSPRYLQTVRGKGYLLRAQKG